MRKDRRKRVPKRARRRAKPFSTLTVTIPSLVRSGHDNDFRELISLLYGALPRLQTMRRTLARSLNLTSSEFAVILSLLRADERAGLKLRDVANDLHVATTHVTVIVGKLECLGWIIKSTGPNDNRAAAIRLTQEARQRLHRLTESLHLVNDIWFRDVTRDELGSVVSFLRRLMNQHQPALDTARDLARTSILERPLGRASLLSD